MASNREERKLMRQRGAASRKVKDVDFGFSFGTPKLEGSQESPQGPKLSTSKPSTPSPSLKGTPTNKRLSAPSVPLSQRTPVRAGSQRSDSRTPGGSRNHLPERPSVYDIPVDDEPEERSPKRRKLGGVRDSSTNEQSNHDSVQNATSYAPETSQHIQEHTTNGTLDTVPPPPSTNGPGSSHQGQAPSPQQELGPQEALLRNQDAGDVGADKENIEDRDSHNRSAGKPPRKRKKKKSVVAKIGKSRKSAASELRRTSGGSRQAIDQPTPSEDPAGSGESPRQPTGKSDTRNPPGGPPKQQQSKKQAKAEKQSSSQKARRVSERRRQPSQKHGGRESREQDEGHPNSGEASKGAEEERVADTAANEANMRAKNDAQREGKEETDASRTSGVQKQNESSKRSRRRRKDAENAESQGAPTAPESESQRASATSKNKSNKKSSKSAPQKDTQKERKSRGESVPVVVHRLTNISALDVDPDDPNIDEEDASKEDGSTGRQYPSRSAANAADVLAQICSETLEKTTSTLDNSISQEPNATRRAEWTGKRKAVEAFSTELDNRLFEMSEINESNFVLASQLKREKKEMETLRSRLMDVRKERGDIALQIDDVRRQYSEDQNAKREQDNLNNAFHDLQLALDRSHQAKDDSAETNPFAGLEFLLRTVAHDVSSTAPDAHGGLLSQVRSFNAQLERTASSLEPK